MVLYNFTELQDNTSTLLTLVEVTNESSGGLLIVGLIMSVFLMQIATMSKFGVSILGSLTYSAWLSFIYTLFFVLAGPGLISIWFMLGFLSISAIGTFALLVSR